MNNSQIKHEIDQHRDDVIKLGSEFIEILIKRLHEHDRSKYESPEIEALTLIREMKYGTPEYLAVCQSDGIKHHYKANSHHPEHFDNGIDGMNIFDLIEYLIDCTAAARRRSGVNPDFRKMQERHKISEQLVSILNNSVAPDRTRPT